MKQLSILTFFLLCFNTSWAQLNGHVFIDSNDNGIKDEIEKGLEGAVVSDGYNIIRTASDGTFTLPGWEKQRFVTLYQGADFSCSKHFIRVDDNTVAYSFAVKPREKKQKVHFVQISDTETFQYGDWVDELKKYSKVHQTDFIIHTGDICYRSGLQWHSENITSKQFGIPVYYCLGNHDLIKGDYGEQFFEQCFGPAWYAFEEGNTLFVITPMMRGDYKPGFNHKEIGAWLKNLLAAYPQDQPKIFFNHDLLTNEAAFQFRLKEGALIDLNKHNLKAWLYGHWHLNMVKKHEDSGVTSYGTATPKGGGIDHSPSCFRLVEVDKNGDTESKLIWTNVSREIEIVSPHKELATLDNNGELLLSVNVYNSDAAVDSVKYGVWGAKGFNWNSSLEVERWQKLHKNSDWNWSARFTPDKDSQYEVVVDAYLKSGEVIHAKKKFQLDQSGTKEAVQQNWHNLGGNEAHVPITSYDHKMPYRLDWLANIGSNIFMSSPVVSNNHVMTASFDDGNAKKCFITCWNAATGEQKWQYQASNGIKNQMVVAKGLLIATDMQGITYALDIEKGSLKWKQDLEFDKLPGFISGLVTDGSIVYTGFGYSLSAIEAETGQILWKNSAWRGGEGATPTMTLAEDVLITSKHWGAIYAHDTKTGELLWSRGDNGLRFRDGVLSFKDGFLWVAERNKTGAGTLHKMDLKTGKSLREYDTGMLNTGTSAPIVEEEQIIVAGSHPGIASFNRETGEREWLFEVDRPLFYTPSYFTNKEQSIETTPVAIGDKVVFGAMDGKLYVLDKTTGKLLWKTRLGSPILTSVAVTENRIYVCDFAGNIYCFSGQ